MKLVIFNNENKVIDALEGLSEVQTKGEDVWWNGGSMQGIKLNYLILDDSVEVSETITKEVIAVDQKENFRKVDFEQENAELKARLESAEMAIITLMDFL